jgi:hypothetical protein
MPAITAKRWDLTADGHQAMRKAQGIIAVSRPLPDLPAGDLLRLRDILDHLDGP